MARRPYDFQMPRRTYLAIYAAVAFTLVLMSGYITLRVMTVWRTTDYTLADGAMAVLLLAAELFLCMHGIGYYRNLIQCGRRQEAAQPVLFGRHATEPVAVLVAAFNEAEDVLEETFAAIRAMDYPMHVYLLDDSTAPERIEGAERVARRYGARLAHRVDRSGYKAGAINDLMPQLTDKYIALLDADQRPMATWLSEMVAHLEANPDIALVQTPQRYVNTDGLPVTNSSRHEQSIFYEYICEGKSHSNAVACCGSNCVIRREALLSLETIRNGRTNYFDESSVTEDFATTVHFHARGWKTDYINHLYAVGMGPETLSAYFTQQARWAMGTMAFSRTLVPMFFRNPRALKPAQWWEHWLVSTYYFVGCAQFIFMLAPILFMAADIQPIRNFSRLYWLFFVPYLISALSIFYVGMRLRHYSVKQMWLANAIAFSTFWCYMKAAGVAVFGLKRAFGVTPKGVGGAIPLKRLWMELTMFVLCVVTAAWCGFRAVVTGGELAYTINGFWAAYHALMLAPLFVHFNRRVTVAPRPSLFEPVRLAGA